MAYVKYHWSPRGKADLCKREDMVMKFDTLCYHCGKRILAGSEATLLQTKRGENYNLHKACADSSCSVLKEK